LGPSAEMLASSARPATFISSFPILTPTMPSSSSRWMTALYASSSDARWVRTRWSSLYLARAASEARLDRR